MTYILENLDRELVLGALGGKNFKQLFYANAKCEKIINAVKALIGD